MNLNIDINRSLKAYPPIKKDEKRGITWKTRKLINRDKVVYHDEHPVYEKVRPDGSKWEILNFM